MWQEIIQVGRKLAALGLVSEAAGNISARLDDTILITKHGAQLGKLDRNSLVLVSLEIDSPEQHQASIELNAHRLIYKNHDWARAVIHAHPPNVIRASILNLKLDYPVVEAPPGSWELAQKVAGSIGIKRCVIARAHGSFCAGSDLAEALKLTLDLESQCGYLVSKHKWLT